jgi:hypothetical protein
MLQSLKATNKTTGTGVPVWITMVLEMNVGIICGCLSGVRPVLVALFPVLFDPTYQTRSRVSRPKYGTHSIRSKIAESFAFQPLSDASNQTPSKIVDPDFSVDAIQDPNYRKQRNFAWASSGGNMDEDSGIPKNAIVVNQAVLVEQEEMGPRTPGLEAPKRPSDVGSEEWIMDDGHPRAL